MNGSYDDIDEQDDIDTIKDFIIPKLLNKVKHNNSDRIEALMTITGTPYAVNYDPIFRIQENIPPK